MRPKPTARGSLAVLGHALGAAPEGTYRIAPSGLAVVAQLLGLVEALELVERVAFDLANSLAGDVERSPDLYSGRGTV